ncbi:MAG TPA: nucleotidyltransferase domain-containing protein [Sulfurospirillum arcachonense]|nr:nucleotidyltransferase domain-containing protein [Sulfurospirillum arcachonense]HIP45419.1 nucleotidyltransferase domain-containing protein [Sulfurospirillum arcachonense]
MRLSKKQHQAIKDTFLKVFKTGNIYLFGSRVDDSKKGGDIDLYLVSTCKEDLTSKKIDFLVKLKSIIGEQKIDVVLSRDKTRPIEQEAIKNGILL